jgi:histidinol-phosphate aminotransferase
MIAIANPNNPTGTFTATEQILEIARSAPHAAVLIDEAYFEFCGQTILPSRDQAPNIFVARTFSKVAGLAALRLGAVIGCEESLKLVRRAMPPFPVNLAALVAAEAAADDRKAMRGYVDEVKRLRVWLSAELQEIGVRIFPSAGNFLLANFGPAGPSLFRKLEKRGILLRDRSKDMGPGFVRITMGTTSEMKELLRAIRKEWRQAS